ncbi:uncharacterized protein LOC110851783 isoform X2 [Folsomia candida]|uniref:uncharacterized protein LOC110851783 isoform X2 n=1 Tax=Folsomia candida TaxID=158441 RepID=UPI000B8F4397|nr:uncharacterized protein LOC110851783 isoform X2 [Folsomia candida]
MDSNYEFERSARLSFEFQAGPRRQSYRPAGGEHRQGEDNYNNNRFDLLGDAPAGSASSYGENNHNLQVRDMMGRDEYNIMNSGDRKTSQFPEWTTVNDRVDFIRRGFNYTDNNIDISSAISLPQQRSNPIGSANFSSIFEMAAELVAQKLEAKFPQPSAPIQLLIPAGMGGNLAFAGPSSTAPTTELITGVVTQVQDTFGMISGDVFFLFNTVTGDRPSLGDKVVVEAFPVSGMPFKFNAKRVQVVSQDFTPNNISSSKSGTDASLNFGPLPKMPSSLNLLHKSKQSKSSSTHPEQRQHRRHSSKDKKALTHSSTKITQSNYRTAGGTLSIDLRDENPVITKDFERQQQENRRNRDLRLQLRTPSPKLSKKRPKSRSKSPKKPKELELFSIRKKRRSRSRSNSSERSDRHKKARRRTNSKSPIRRRRSISPKRNRKGLEKGKKDLNLEKSIRQADGTSNHKIQTKSRHGSADRRPKRPPRTLASIIRYHISTPPPEEERFVPNPCAKNAVPISLPPVQIQNQQPISGGPSVLYLHNPSFDPPVQLQSKLERPFSSGDGLKNKVARDSERDNVLHKFSAEKSSLGSLDRFLNERKLSEIEAQRKKLQAQKKALESEIKKSRKEGAIKSNKISIAGTSKKHQLKEREAHRKEEERSKRGTEGPVRRVEIDEISHSSRTAKKVEWITPAQLQTISGRPETGNQGRVRIDDRDKGIRWELPHSRRTTFITDVERQEEELSEREKKVLERMWLIQSQRRDRN